MSYPKYLLKHRVTQEVFPEIWDRIIQVIDTHGEEIAADQFYFLVQQFDELDLPSNHKAWKVVRRLFDSHTNLRSVSVENAIQVRNIALKRMSEDIELIDRLEKNVITLMFNFGKFKAQSLCRNDSPLITNFREMRL